MTYTINGKTYSQKPLVLGQIKTLTALLKGMTFGDLSPFGVIATLGESLARCMALILIPEGSPVMGRDIDALESEFDEYVDIKTTAQVVRDFFFCNPPSLLSDLFRDVAKKIGEQTVKNEVSNGS